MGTLVAALTSDRDQLIVWFRDRDQFPAARAVPWSLNNWVLAVINRIFNQDLLFSKVLVKIIPEGDVFTNLILVL